MKNMTSRELNEKYPTAKVFAECLLAELPSMTEKEAKTTILLWASNEKPLLKKVGKSKV